MGEPPKSYVERSKLYQKKFGLLLTSFLLLPLSTSVASPSIAKKFQDRLIERGAISKKRIALFGKNRKPTKTDFCKLMIENTILNMGNDEFFPKYLIEGPYIYMAIPILDDVEKRSVSNPLLVTLKVDMATNELIYISVDVQPKRWKTISYPNKSFLIQGKKCVYSFDLTNYLNPESYGL